MDVGDSFGVACGCCHTRVRLLTAREGMLEWPRGTAVPTGGGAAGVTGTRASATEVIG